MLKIAIWTVLALVVTLGIGNISVAADVTVHGVKEVLIASPPVVSAERELVKPIPDNSRVLWLDLDLIVASTERELVKPILLTRGGMGLPDLIGMAPVSKGIKISPVPQMEVMVPEKLLPVRVASIVVPLPVTHSERER